MALCDRPNKPKNGGITAGIARAGAGAGREVGGHASGAEVSLESPKPNFPFPNLSAALFLLRVRRAAIGSPSFHQLPFPLLILLAFLITSLPTSHHHLSTHLSCHYRSQ